MRVSTVDQWVQFHIISETHPRPPLSDLICIELFALLSPVDETISIYRIVYFVYVFIFGFKLIEQSHLYRMILNFPEFGRFFTPTRSLGFLVAGIVDT